MKVLILIALLGLTGCLAISSVKHKCNGPCELEIERSAQVNE